MCGRYSLTAKAELIKERFGVDEIRGEITLPRYNIAPSQEAPVILYEGGKRVLTQFQWGLSPPWSKQLSKGKIINARTETVGEKNFFASLLKENRCLVVADGFYEWVNEGRARVPLRILLKSKEPFAFAGLWDKDSFTILTISSSSHPLMKSIHPRMPLLLNREDEELWLERELKPAELMNKVLKPYPAEEMTAYEVSRVVNNPKNEMSECIKPLASWKSWERGESPQLSVE